MRTRRLTLGTHGDSGQMYRVYRNQAAAAYLSFISIFSVCFLVTNLSFSSDSAIAGLWSDHLTALVI